MLCQVEQATLAEAERDPEPNKALQPAKEPVSPLGSRFAQVIPEIMRTVAAQRVPTGMPEIVCLPGQVGRGFSENTESFFLIRPCQTRRRLVVVVIVPRSTFERSDERTPYHRKKLSWQWLLVVEVKRDDAKQISFLFRL